MALPLTRSSSSLSSTSTAHSPTLHPTKAAKSSPTIPKSPLSESKVAIPFGIPIRAQRTLESSLATPLTLIFSHHPQPPSTPIQNSYPGSGSAEDPYLVDWLPGEAANPYNWKSSFRWTVTAIIAVATLCIAFASSSYSAALQDVLVVFPGTKQETGIAGISLYVLGFGVGPLVWAPLSEMIGRRRAFNVSYPLFALFNMAGALAPNITTILITRFLAGTFGAAPLTNAGGQIGDMWAAVMLALSLLFVPETYAPTLLRRKAALLQKEADAAGTGEVFIAKYDKVKKSTFEIVKAGMSRPFEMMFKELIVFCLGLYAAIIYGTLYLFFTAYPIVFQQNRGWSTGISGLAFLGIGCGLLIGNALNPLGKIWYQRAVRLAGPGQPVAPECRLPMACAGAVMLPIGLFVFAWTCTNNVHWIVPILASVPFGCGFLLIFTGINMYLIDSYALFAASALAANAVMRSIFGTVFPLFSVQLYDNLGLHWAGTLLAFLSLMCTPMPFLFMKYGPYLRRKSRYAPSAPATPPPQGAVAATGVKGTSAGDKEKMAGVNRPDEALEPEWAADAGEHAGKELRGTEAV